MLLNPSILSAYENCGYLSVFKQPKRQRQDQTSTNQSITPTSSGVLQPSQSDSSSQSSVHFTSPKH